MNAEELKTKKISILGAARSGIAAAKMLKQIGCEIFVSDNAKINLNIIDELNNLKIPFEGETHSEKVFNCDIIVVSPSIPKNSTILNFAVSKNIKIVSEIEIASWVSKGKIIAVTGTNGKTTTTTLIGEIFKNFGFRTFVGGNIGNAFSNFALDTYENDFIVLEVSSFQLEFIEYFHPSIAIVTNIAPDHLERYDDMMDYVLTKFKILKNQNSSDYFIFNHSDFYTQKTLEQKKISSKLIPFSSNEKLQFGLYQEGENIFYVDNNLTQKVCNLKDLKIFGKHNYENIMASIGCAIFSKIPILSIEQSINEFRGVEHRIEFIREIEGVQFFNDSKSTNVDSLQKALESFDVDRKIILLLGGREAKNGNNYSQVSELVQKKVKKF